MRQPGICRRKRDGHYYCTIDGTQIPLGNDLEKAQKKFHREMLKRRPRGGVVEADATVAVLIERFLIWVEVNRDARTLEWYARFLSSLKYDLDARELKPSHVERWLEAIPEGSHYMAVRALQRLYNWAVKQRILEVNPIKGIDRPTHEPREVYIEPDRIAENQCSSHGFWGPGGRLSQMEAAETCTVSTMIRSMCPKLLTEPHQSDARR